MTEETPIEFKEFIEFMKEPEKYLQNHPNFEFKKQFQQFYSNWKLAKNNKFYTKKLDEICLMNLTKSKDVTSKIQKKKLNSDRSSYDQVKFLTILSQQFSKKWLSKELINYISNELKGRIDPSNPLLGLEILQKIFKEIYEQWILWEFEFTSEIDEIMEFKLIDLKSDILSLLKAKEIQFNWNEIFPQVENILEQ